MDNDADFERHINSAMDALESAIDEDYDGDFKERYDLQGGPMGSGYHTRRNERTTNLGELAKIG
ncbi:hypothetical protein ZHAS_00008935 [Anopheles sinensis]|uniref:Uncharacterized protein n=1 Tax=Anopheles sinensis TaxID=74873 RepID=A0A084VTR1_ANOSI|nr:hypothetical protein ZHAS_00008935 [Anopheles sinensis]